MAILAAVPALAACGSSATASGSPSPSGSPSATASGSPASGSPAPTTTRPAAARCGPLGSTTLAAGRSARVYLTRGVVYGCAAGSGRTYRLGARGLCLAAPRVGAVVVEGTLAAYAVQTCETDTSFSRVLVRNLSGGKLLTSSPAISGVPAPESFQAVSTIVLKPDSSVAWSAGITSIGRRGVLYQVRLVDGRGDALLDSGARIAPRSLRLRGSTLTWRDRRVMRWAILR